MNNVRIVKAEKFENNICKLLIGSSTAGNACSMQGYKNDLPRILEIYSYAREFMRENGNPTQWENFSAIKDSLVNDMENGNLYLIRDDEYGTIHRVASDGRIHGMMGMIVQFCSERIVHLRIDTHADNKIMQHLILKNGFKRCGIIHISDGSPRIAYERI